MQSNSFYQQPRAQDSILFDVNPPTLVDMNLTEHITRLEQMSRFLADALNKNKSNLLQLKEVVKSQINNLKNNTQILQTNVKDQTNLVRNLFEPAIQAQVKKINEMKNEVQKINAEQLTTKKYVLNLEATINHSQTQIGFRQFKN